MASEGTSTVPRMGSFKRSFLGYRRTEVDAALAGEQVLRRGRLALGGVALDLIRRGDDETEQEHARYRRARR